MTAVEWLVEDLGVYLPISITSVQSSIDQAKELENKQQDEFAIGFVEWFTSEKSEYSIMYGNQEKRFATFTKAYTTKQLLEQFKNKLDYETRGNSNMD